MSWAISKLSDFECERLSRCAHEDFKKGNMTACMTKIEQYIFEKKKKKQQDSPGYTFALQLLEKAKFVSVEDKERDQSPVNALKASDSLDSLLCYSSIFDQDDKFIDDDDIFDAYKEGRKTMKYELHCILDTFLVNNIQNNNCR